MNPSVVGIDLGTTFSLAAYVRDGTPVVVRDAAGSALVPSVISFHPDGTVLVGTAARERALSDPEHTIFSVKRLMGRTLADLEKELKLIPHQIVERETDTGRKVLRVRIAGREHTPEELSAMILREVRKRAGDPSKAVADFTAAVALDPGRGEAHNLLGVALDGRGSHDLAIDHYKQALKLLPDDAQILNNLGYSFYLNEDLSSAKKYLQRAARRAPRDERVLNNLATVQYRLGKRKDALESFVRASDPFTGRMNLAALLSRFGNYSEAAELYEEAHRLDPRSAAPLEKLAAAYERMGRKSDAEGVRQAAAALKLNGATTATNGN
jgi:Flp pilus assembly protein TadD